MEEGQSTDMTTLSQVITKVENNGYTEDFKVNDNGKMCSPNSDKEYTPDDLIIDKVYRFEGESDPADMAVLYAITANDGLKGKLIDAFGTYESRKFAEFIRSVKLAEGAQT
jgi:hypothetical protein